MTGNAVREVWNAFADMLRTNVGQRMLVAAEAGVLPPIARGVASETRRVVILVKGEQTFAIKCRRFSTVLTMVCTIKRQMFYSPLGAIAVYLRASKNWIVQFNQIVRSPDGE